LVQINFTTEVNWKPSNDNADELLSYEKRKFCYKVPYLQEMTIAAE
jgi:hypothetical protein